ncbi:hypothetical protein FQN49_005817, partial [Arthroderma sp. PD_2]
MIELLAPERSLTSSFPEIVDDIAIDTTNSSHVRRAGDNIRWQKDDDYDLAPVSQPPELDFYDLRPYYYYDESQGEGTTIYVVDTGAEHTHDEFKNTHFEKYIWPEPKSVPHEERDFNPKFHGTGVLSRAVGRTVGIARKASVVVVVKSNKDGRSTIYNFIDALLKTYDDITEHHPNGKVVINLSSSLRKPKDPDLDDMCRQLFTDLMTALTELEHVVVVTTAGNEGPDKEIDQYPQVLGGIIPKLVVVGGVDFYTLENMYQTADYVRVSAIANKIRVAIGSGSEIDEEGHGTSFGREKKCGMLKDNKYATRGTIHDLMNTKFCPEAVNQTTLDENSGSISRTYLQGTLEEMVIAMDWAPEVKFTPDSKSCERFLHEILDGCDGNNPDNPMNWKSGGSILAGLVKYRIEPKAPRKPALKAPGGGCDTTLKNTYSLGRNRGYTQAWIWGVGWSNSDSGEMLKEKLEACHLLCGSFKFSYGLGGDGREWSVEAKTAPVQKPCIEKAIKEASGTDKIKCSGKLSYNISPEHIISWKGKIVRRLIMTSDNANTVREYLRKKMNRSRKHQREKAFGTIPAPEWLDLWSRRLVGKRLTSINPEKDAHNHGEHDENLAPLFFCDPSSGILESECAPPKPAGEAPTQPKSLLMALPTELLLQITEEALNPCVPYHDYHSREPSVSWLKFSGISLIFTCKLLYVLGRPIALYNYTFDITQLPSIACLHYPVRWPQVEDDAEEVQADIYFDRSWFIELVSISGLHGGIDWKPSE